MGSFGDGRGGEGNLGRRRDAVNRRNPTSIQCKKRARRNQSKKIQSVSSDGMELGYTRSSEN